MRLDQAVAAHYPDISRRKARELIGARRVLVNDHPVAVASREVTPADRITIVAELPELDIIETGADWIAVNKPAGMPTQPARDRKERSLEELLRVQKKTVWVVHRLDTPTSGVVVFATTKEAAARLSSLFASGAIRKTYAAVVDGLIDRELTIDTPLARTSESTFGTNASGRAAVTRVHPLRPGDETTLVEVGIETGRTHQIRVHLASIGHPVVGDRKYGSGRPAPRLMLHAWKLEHESLGTLVAPLPEGFAEARPSS